MEDPETPEDIRKLLEQCIHPKREAAKIHFLMEVFSIKFCRYKNSEVAALLGPLLESLSADSPDDPNYDEQCDPIRDFLQGLKGENYESYVRPSSDVLAKAARVLLDKFHETVPSDSHRALEKFEAEWFANTYDMPTAILALPHNPRALCLVRAATGHRTIITVSFFTMVAEKTSRKTRVRTVEAYYALLQLLYKSGNVQRSMCSTKRNF